MAEANVVGRTDCPWCHRDLDVVKSPKSGYHYANCPSCNGHFRNVPIALVDMKGKEKPQPKPEAGASALEQLRNEHWLDKLNSRAEPEVKETALERLRRGFG